MHRLTLIGGLCALLVIVLALVVFVSGSQDASRPAFAGPPPTPDCSVTSWDWEGGNCFGLEGLWHHETLADVSGMSGGMLAFNQNCTGPGLTGCDYDTGARVLGLATSPAFAATNGAVLTFKTARRVELPFECPNFVDITTVRYSINGGTTYLVLDLLATGSITAGSQTLETDGRICNVDQSNTKAQTVKVKLPPGTTNVAFEFDSQDDFVNDLAGQFIDDVVVSICGAPACPTQPPPPTPTFTVTPTFTSTATDTPTPTDTPTVTNTPTITATPKSPPTPKATPTGNPTAIASQSSLSVDADCEIPLGPPPDISVETTRVVLVGTSFHVCIFAEFPMSGPAASGYQARVYWDEVALDLIADAAGNRDLWHLQPLNSGGAPNGAAVTQVFGPADDDVAGDDAYVTLRAVDTQNESVILPYVGPVAQFEFVCQTHGTAIIDLRFAGASDGSAFLTPLGELKTKLPSAVIACLDPDLDSDNDGCTNGREFGSDETLGGRRGALNPNDFYDVLGGGGGPPDRVIDLPNDILGVIQHFAPSGAPPYDVAFDRGPSSGPNPWNMTAPDGVIDLPNDILGVIQQFGHSCV